MAEVLRSFDDVVDESGSYHARVVGRQGDDGMWEGWLEFEPSGSLGDVLVTGVETTQPQRVHLVYWATGLTPVYLEGALHRARNPTVVRVRLPEKAVSDAPAPRVVTIPAPPATAAAVLDPFEVGRKSLDILEQELHALNSPRLLNIIAAFDLNPRGQDVSRMSAAQLVRFIVLAVDAELARRAR
ncbi:MAG TPA: hypothetical protein VIX63_10995 [Vicinamibacterales bacterium]